MASIHLQERLISHPFPIKILSISGEVDESNQHLLEKQLQDCIDDTEHDRFVFNMSKLEYMNSGVIGILVSFHEQFVSANKSFVFSSVHPALLDIIDHVGLTQVIEVYQNDEEACLSFER